MGGQANVPLYIMPTHMAAAHITIANSAVKTTRVSTDLAYERVLCQPFLVELGTVGRSTFILRDL